MNFHLERIPHTLKLLFSELSGKEEFLSEATTLKNPVEQFKKWYDEAIKSNIPFYEAVTLSTATKEGKPSGRMVLLKGFDEKGFVFFTNYKSRKGNELEKNHFASLTFYWSKLGKQVRVEGTVEKVTAQESDDYFASRPRGSRIGAWTSEQSAVVPDRHILIEKMRQLEKQYEGKPVPRPPYWGGYLLIPQTIEFWQNRINRLHDRILFTLQNDKSWKIERLAP